MVCVSFHFLTGLRMRSGRVYQTFLQGLEWAVLAIPLTPLPPHPRAVHRLLFPLSFFFP